MMAALQRNHLQPPAAARGGFRDAVRPRSLALLAAAMLLVSACGSTEKIEYVERPVEDIYQSASAALEDGNYAVAAAQFDEVERQHPYSPWATKAQIMAAYAYYEDNKYDEAVAALDRFIRLHPAHKDVPYALYLKGICYYERISDVGRDQEMTANAREALEDLVNRFPESQYSRDARLKLDLIHDHLAGKEMNIGRFYLKQGQYVSAINRFQRVIADYQTTTHAAEALHRLVEAYMAVGLQDEAQRTAAVLGHNFPGSEWYRDAYSLMEGPVGTPPSQAAQEPWYKVW